MSPSAHRTPPSDPPESDADLEDERSSVRPRVEVPESQGGSSPRQKLESGEWSANERVLRSSRVEQLVRMGKVLLADLPADHPRARVLRAAIARRDPVVLEGLLLNWQAEPPARGTRPTRLPGDDD
ncbi:MAG: hypothetical protein KC776_06300 [Myxococcales bacterium]|nr:hypothetical protein [Myxococcales bacterium]MCB9578732.1 hypothetical protein [Polyangiaceae bacterium]